ncbi:50S ribosomal protein L29 [Cerasicoccus arenae]|uniref:Large ribosomal subunit protein uL29 n=1 Tax=Cerasicoccus arenae TaxID=424488 RepID=A0A8J3GDS6_9BACT|nr:50S ribosomal protein L29 [Cerasicoccus arenae]MBK1857338.1 50S ribosomal protein L29 [Cerasicoccus arenae]GHC08850.1 50S ribosomal protein L29 [Cerasicoccus arenae]
MNAKDIRELSPEELNKKLRESRDELVNLRVRKQVGQVENPAQLRTIRRDIARIETILRQKGAAVA